MFDLKKEEEKMEQPPKPIDFKKAAKEKKKEDIKKAAYARKLNNQYEFLKKWDRGEINGMECCEAIELEGKRSLAIEVMFTPLN
jgi:DNA-binding transcriptional regulator YiaG